MIMLENQNVQFFFAKANFPSGCGEAFENRKGQDSGLWTCVISDSYGNEIFGNF